MSLHDPIADMLTRIRNGVRAGHTVVSIPSSKIKAEIARILEEEGFVEGHEVVASDGSPQPVLRVHLKYVGERRDRRPVITDLKRVSKPGQRIYVGKEDVPWVLSGMGVAIMTTSRGIMTGLQARKFGIGGEVLCEVW